MIGKIHLTLQFPGDENPTDVSHLVISRSLSIDHQFCSDEYRSSVDICRFSLKHDLTIVTKLQAAHARIAVIATDFYTSAPVFCGAIEPTAAQSAGQTVGNINLEATDNSWRLDEPIAESFSLPESIGGSGWYLYNSASPGASIFHFLAIMAGYLPDDIKEASFPDVIPYAAATAEETTYREYLDDLLFEYGYVVHTTPSGLLYIAAWMHDGEAYDEELGPSDLSTVTPVAWSKTAEYRDGAKIVWSKPSIIENALIYRDSLPVSGDGVFEGEAIAAGDYYPKDSDINEIFQDFVESWLDTPYLSRSTRLKNKDLSLITTSGHVVSFKADAGVVVDYQTFEGLRARVRFRNTTAATAKIYWFEIHATALIRLSRNNIVAPEGSANPLEYTSQFLMEQASSVKLARAMAMGVAFADFKYTFALNRSVPIGSVVRLVEARMGIDTLALVQRCAESSDPQTQVTALALTDPTGTTYREWASLVTSGWLQNQSTKNKLDSIAGQPTDRPAGVQNLYARAEKEAVVVTWDPASGTTVRTAAIAYILERSTNAGATWYDTDGVLDDGSITPARITGNPYAWAFDRATDGYPEAVTDSQGYAALDQYRFRIKAVNAAGVASLNWTTLELVVTDGYGTWLPSAPTGGVGSSSGRGGKVNWDDSSVYGLARYEIQIALESADPMWYKPAQGLSAYASEDNYRQSAIVGDVRAVTISQFTQTLPLNGQNDDPPNPSSTAYIYRVRAVSTREWTGAEGGSYEEADDGKTAGPWSATIAVLAEPAGAYDLAHSSILKDALSAENLAVLFGYMAVLSGGLEDVNNRQILSDYPGRTLPIGYHRWGDADFKVEFNPTTRKYYIGFEDGSKFIEFDAVAGTFSLGGVEFKVEDKRIIAYSGEGAYRTAVSVQAASVTWLNAPVGGPEEEVASIRRTSEKTNDVIMSGSFKGERYLPVWEGMKLASGTSQGTYTSLVQTRDGLVRLFYRKTSDGFLYQRVMDPATGSFGEEIAVTAFQARYPGAFQFSDGEFRLAYTKQSDGHIYEITFDFDASAWSSPVEVVSYAADLPGYGEDRNGTKRIAYSRTAAEGEAIYEKKWGTGAWGAEAPIGGLGLSANYISRRNGELRLAYTRSSDDSLVWKEYDFDTNSWSASVVINSEASKYAMLFESDKGELRVMYSRPTDIIVQRIYGDSGWSAESDVTDEAALYPSAIYTSEGKAICVFHRVSDGYIYSEVLSLYSSMSPSDLLPIPRTFAIAGVARNTGGTWRLIDDADHKPFGISKIENISSGGFKIYYDRIASKVGVLHATPDETYAEALFNMGGSVGLEYSGIVVTGEYKVLVPTTKCVLWFRRSSGVYGYVYYNGTTWAHSDSAGITSLSFNADTGVLTINHSNAGLSELVVTPRNGQSYDRPEMNSYGASVTNVIFIRKGVIPNDRSEIAGANVWLSGYMYE